MIKKSTEKVGLSSKVQQINVLVPSNFGPISFGLRKIDFYNSVDDLNIAYILDVEADYLRLLTILESYFKGTGSSGENTKLNLSKYYSNLTETNNLSKSQEIFQEVKKKKSDFENLLKRTQQQNMNIPQCSEKNLNSCEEKNSICSNKKMTKNGSLDYSYKSKKKGLSQSGDIFDDNGNPSYTLITRTDFPKTIVIRETFTDRDPDFDRSSKVDQTTLSDEDQLDDNMSGNGSDIVHNLRASELNITVFNCSSVGDYYNNELENLQNSCKSIFSEFEENPNLMHPTIQKIKEENIVRLHEKNGETKYVGELDKNGKYHGLGKEFDMDGNLVKEGYYKEGILSGNWARIYQETSTNYGKRIWFMSFEGSMLDGLEHGTGKEFYPSGKIFYEGNYKHGQRVSSKGKILYENGNVKYVGGFMNSVYEGLGILYYINGIIHYKGQFEKGKFSDKDGTWQSHTEDLIYTGGFRDNVYCGKGKIVVKNTNGVLEGVFFNGMSLWDKKIIIKRDNTIDKECCQSFCNDESAAYSTYSKHSVWVVDKGTDIKIGRNDKYKTLNMIYKFGYLSRNIVLTLLEHICLAQCISALETNFLNLSIIHWNCMSFRRLVTSNDCFHNYALRILMLTVVKFFGLLACNIFPEDYDEP